MSKETKKFTRSQLRLMGIRIDDCCARSSLYKGVIAEKCGLHPTALSQIISGSRPIPDSALDRFCELMHVKREYLLYGDTADTLSFKSAINAKDSISLLEQGCAYERSFSIYEKAYAGLIAGPYIDLVRSLKPNGLTLEDLKNMFLK